MKKIILILIIFANSIQKTFSSSSLPESKSLKAFVDCRQHEFSSEQWRTNLEHLGINHQGYNGLTALHAAVRDKDTSFLKKLLSTEGVIVDSKCFAGDTPLGVAVKQCDTDIIALLVKARAHLNEVSLFFCKDELKFKADKFRRRQVFLLVCDELKFKADEFRKRQVRRRQDFLLVCDELKFKADEFRKRQDGK